jgi:DNA polymerase-4
VESQAQLHEASLALIRSVLPPPKGIRLVGVTLSNFLDEAVDADEAGLLRAPPTLRSAQFSDVGPTAILEP